MINARYTKALFWDYYRMVKATYFGKTGIIILDSSRKVKLMVKVRKPLLMKAHFMILQE